MNNSIFSWATTATPSGLFSSAPALPPAQQSVDHLADSSIGSSQVDFNGTALLVDVVVKKFTGKKYLRPLDNPPLTRLDIIEKNSRRHLVSVKNFINVLEVIKQFNNI